MLTIRCRLEVPNPETETKHVLSSVIAFVDVHNGGANASDIWRRKLRELGADVTSRWNTSVTHVIFKGETLLSAKYVDTILSQTATRTFSNESKP